MGNIYTRESTMSNRLTSILATINSDPAITSPSSAVAERMVEFARVRKSSITVCLGAGDGTIVAKVYAAKRPDSVLYVVEQDPSAASTARSILPDRRDVAVVQDAPRAFLWRMSVLDAGSRATAIVSILPLLAMGRDESVAALREARNALAPNGIAVWLQNTPAMAPFVSRYFSITNAAMVASVPPSILYVCKRRPDEGESRVVVSDECPCKKKATAIREASALSSVVNSSIKRR